MLTRRGLTAAVLAGVLSLLLPAGVAFADGGGNCDQNPDPSCVTWGNGPGSGGGNGGGNGSGGSGCTWQGQSVPCTDPDFGVYMGGGCYWQKLVPQPAAGPPGGQDPTKGAWGVRSCYTAPGSGVVTQVYYWMDYTAAGPTPEQLAQHALAKIHLLGAQVGMAPSPEPGSFGLIGDPVWMWTTVTPGTWGPQTASASGGAITVTVTAQATRIVWDMGDGHSVSCDNPGTPYQPSYGKRESPTCGYTHHYQRASTSPTNPHGRYHITATTYWTVNWAGGGQAGVLNPTSQSQSSVEIREAQVVTQ